MANLWKQLRMIKYHLTFFNFEHSIFRNLIYKEALINGCYAFTFLVVQLAILYTRVMGYIFYQYGVDYFFTFYFGDGVGLLFFRALVASLVVLYSWLELFSLGLRQVPKTLNQLSLKNSLVELVKIYCKLTLFMAYWVLLFIYTYGMFFIFWKFLGGQAFIIWTLLVSLTLWYLTFQGWLTTLTLYPTSMGSTEQYGFENYLWLKKNVPWARWLTGLEELRQRLTNYQTWYNAVIMGETLADGFLRLMRFWFGYQLYQVDSNYRFIYYYPWHFCYRMVYLFLVIYIYPFLFFHLVHEIVSGNQVLMDAILSLVLEVFDFY